MAKPNELFLVSYLPTAQMAADIIATKEKQVERWAVISHDKDVYEESIFDKDTGKVVHEQGTPKPQHLHIYLKLYQNRQPIEIANWFKIKQPSGLPYICLYKPVYDRIGVIKYLTHNTQKAKKMGKYQYCVDNIIGFGYEDLPDNDDPKDNTYYIVEDCLQGVDKLTMLKKYGRDYLYHYTVISQFVQDIAKEACSIEINPYCGMTSLTKSVSCDCEEYIQEEIKL